MEIERTIITYDDFPSLISKFVQFIKKNNPVSLFNGMSDQDIKELTFGENVYQLEQAHYASHDFLVKIIDNKLLFQVQYDNTTLEVGYVPADEQIKSILKQKYKLSIGFIGGKFKKIVTDSNGQESVQQFFEPITLKLVFSYKEPTPQKSKETTTSKTKSTEYHQTIGMWTKRFLTVLVISAGIIALFLILLGLFVDL